MYRAADRTCILSDEKTKPTGRMELSDQPDMNYYEKVCLKGIKSCPKGPIFQKFQQMMLVGFAAFVKEFVPTVGACLDLCVR